MSADIKSLRSSIRSVDSMLHLTSAMGLVASSKIYRASEEMIKARQYAETLKIMTATLASCPECQRSPYMRTEGEERTRLVVIAGDRGLCGGYNSNVFKAAEEFPEAEKLCIGKRACERFGGELTLCGGYTCEQGHELAVKLCEDFAGGKFDRLGLVSTEYVSMMTQTASVKWLLPFEKAEGSRAGGIEFEPDEVSVMNAAVVEYVYGMIMWGVREGFASENAARRMAMDNAGRNAREMLDDLRLTYNRARQGAITQEITEIVAGSGR
ncbi:MAG: ATP synthase F1 subunit gamma [Clostridia bacterium]|nr:ATP synthase F1 subunit gamma [Clostridia bacterium]